MITAAPVAFSLAGKNTESVGCDTFETTWEAVFASSLGASFALGTVLG